MQHRSNRSCGSLLRIFFDFTFLGLFDECAQGNSGVIKGCHWCIQAMALEVDAEHADRTEGRIDKGGKNGHVKLNVGQIATGSSNNEGELDAVLMLQ